MFSDNRHRVSVSKGRTAPTTWGQDYMLERVELLGADSSSSNLHLAVQVARNVEISKVENICCQLVNEAESLRTRFSAESLGTSRQAALDEIDVTIRLAEGTNIDETVASLRRSLSSETFSVTEGEVIRFGIALDGAGEPRWLIVVASHIVADAHSILLLKRRLEELLRVDRTQSETRLLHPIDYQPRENDPRVVARSDRAISRWLATLQASRPILFDDGLERCWRFGKWDSSNYKWKARSVANRLQISPSSVHLWLLANVAARLFDEDELTIVSRYANRDATNQSLVGQLHQEVPLRVRVNSGQPLAQTLTGIHGSLIAAYRYAHFDAAKFTSKAVEIMPRGEVLARFGIVFNDLSGLGTDCEGNDLSKASSFKWLAGSNHDISALYFSPAGIGNFDWMVDTRALGGTPFSQVLDETEEFVCRSLSMIPS